MTRLWPDGQPVHLALDDQGMPKRFVWQGRLYVVAHIWQRWHLDLGWWEAEGRIWREYVGLSTDDGLFCVLYHDRLQAQ